MLGKANIESDLKVWTVFDKRERLVLVIEGMAGEFCPTRLSEPTTPCEFAYIQVFNRQKDAHLREILQGCQDLAGFIASLSDFGYRIREGFPFTSRFPLL